MSKDQEKMEGLKRTAKRLGIGEVLAHEMRKVSIDSELERQLRLRETPARTIERHQRRQETKELDQAKESVRDKAAGMGMFPEDEMLTFLATIHLTDKKELAEFRRRRRERAIKQNDEFLEAKARDAWRRDEKVIRQSKARQRAKRNELRKRRGEMPV